MFYFLLQGPPTPPPQKGHWVDPPWGRSIFGHRKWVPDPDSQPTKDEEDAEVTSKKCKLNKTHFLIHFQSRSIGLRFGL